VIRTGKAALALCLALTACSSASKSSASGGPFHYESTEGNVTINSTVDVRYDKGAAIVGEAVNFGTASANIENRLDPKTFSTISYTMRNDPEGIDPIVIVTPSGASVKTNDRGGAVVNAPVPGAPSFVFGNYASSFVLLPSLVRATHPRTINAYMPTVFHGKALAMKLSVFPSASQRPTTVPQGDVAIGFAPPSARKRVAMLTLWYDPATSVVDAINIGNATAFLRKP